MTLSRLQFAQILWWCDAANTMHQGLSIVACPRHATSHAAFAVAWLAACWLGHPYAWPAEGETL